MFSVCYLLFVNPKSSLFASFLYKYEGGEEREQEQRKKQGVKAGAERQKL